jgi:hypothetical protein
MNDPEGFLRPVLVGNQRYPRYAIALHRSPFSPTLFWTGTNDDPWSADVSEATKWADYGALMTAIRRLETAEPDDSPGAQ